MLNEKNKFLTSLRGSAIEEFWHQEIRTDKH